MKPRFSLPFQLFSQRLFCDSVRDRFHTAGNQLHSHQYGSETTADLHFFFPHLLLVTLCLAEEQRILSFLKRHDYFCVNLCWVLWHRVKHGGGVLHVGGRVGTLRNNVQSRELALTKWVN